MIVVSVATLGSTVLIPTRVEALSLKVELEILGPPGNGALTPLWVGFHDGNFDTFNPGDSASSGIELIAEDGFSGLESPEALAAIGVNLSLINNLNGGISNVFSSAIPTGVQGLVTAIPLVGTLPGQSPSTIFRVDPSQNRFFSYAAMFFPSNDAFVADLAPLELFDVAGNFLGADFIIAGTEVYDAGTEVNDEDVINSVPFFPSVVGQGTPEGGTIQLHPGFLPLGAGGVLDSRTVLPPPLDINFSTADFTVPGYQVARIRVSQVPEPHHILGSAMALVFGVLFQRQVLKQRSKQ
jgi:hypothetical protein